MSEFCIYVKLPRIAGRWVVHQYGSPVRFPRRSWENLVVLSALRPSWRRIGEGEERESSAGSGGSGMKGEEGMVAIAVPWNMARPVNLWNTVTREGARAIRAAVETAFVSRMCQELTRELAEGGGQAGDKDGGQGGQGGSRRRMIETIERWCMANGLQDEDVEAVRQRFYRMRRAGAAHG